MNPKVEVVGGVNETIENKPKKWGEWHYFTSALYGIRKPEFLNKVNKISMEYIERRKSCQELNEIYPVYMSENMFEDERLSDFSNFILSTSHEILASQGYKMDLFDVFFHEMWVQEHHKSSGQEQHIHGAGSQISGFYFLEVPKDSSRVVLHDPRPAKVYANLPEENPGIGSYASQMITFTPEPGATMFTNSWLPHSFNKNSSDKPFRFIHFNLGVKLKSKIEATVV